MANNAQLTPLGELIEIKHGFAFKSEFFTSESNEFILLTPGNFHKDQMLYFGTNTKYYTGEIPPDYILKNGDLVIVMTDLTKEMNILGNAVIIRSDKQVLHNQRIGKVAAIKQNEIDFEFLMYLLNTDLVRNEIKATASGTTVRHTSPSRILSIKVPIPRLLEQRKIAAVLHTWDEAIRLTQDLIAAKQQRKKGLMQRLLTGQVRFPGFIQGKPARHESPFGHIPGDWKPLHLGDLGHTYTGLSGKNRDHFGSGKPYIPYKNIFDNSRIDPKRLDFVEINDGEKQYRVKYGDIFFTTSSETPDEVGMSSVLLDDLGECFLNSFCFGFRLHDFQMLWPEYAQYFFRSELFRKQMFKLAQGATRYNLSKTETLKSLLLLPPIEEQQMIAAVLQACDREIELLQQKVAALQQQKKGLMQRLLTGQVRVKV